jgi:hypothetical protein
MISVCLLSFMQNGQNLSQLSLRTFSLRTLTNVGSKIQKIFKNHFFVCFDQFWFRLSYSWMKSAQISRLPIMLAEFKVKYNPV